MAVTQSIFDFKDYRSFLRWWLESQDSARGQQSRLAKAARMSSTLMSLILKEEKHLTLEQAGELADYFSFNSLETDYFFSLVELGRAGTVKLKTKLQAKLREIQRQSQKLSRRVGQPTQIPDELKAIYYSQWIFTAIMNLVAIKGLKSDSAVARHLQIPEERVMQAVAFMKTHGLLKVSRDGYSPGAAQTHINFESPFVNRHHQNWRLLGFQNMEKKSEDDLFFTSPMSLSVEVATTIRQMLPALIEEIMKKVGPSPSETAACLNIDWFRY